MPEVEPDLRGDVMEADAAELRRTPDRGRHGSVGGSARAEMLLERLPYLPTILRKSRPLAPSTAATIREIQKITTFHGATGSRGGLEEEGLETLERQPGEQEQWATDKDTPASPRKKKGVRFVESARGRDEESAIAGLAAKGASLVLEDDDIED